LPTFGIYFAQFKVGATRCPPGVLVALKRTATSIIFSRFEALAPSIRLCESMKALVKASAEVGLSLQDVPEPSYGINDVLIRIRKTGICGTDVHIYNWDAWAQRTIPVPMVVGHEFVGEIVAVGSNVADFKVGDICATSQKVWG
jgi:hypothetical protein